MIMCGESGFFSDQFMFKFREKIRSRKKISIRSNQQPSCVVILDADRKSSFILETDQSQIHIAFLVSLKIPLGSSKRITCPVPVNDTNLTCHFRLGQAVLP